MVEVRVGPALARFVVQGDAAGNAFGVALPTEPCRAAVAGDRAALWLGPEEWLLLAPDAQAPEVVAALVGAAPSVVEVSDAWVSLLVEGPGAARLLSAGCPLDLHANAFPVGMATRTVLGSVGILLWRRGDTAWHLEVGRSYAAHARAFLAEAARGLPNF